MEEMIEQRTKLSKKKIKLIILIMLLTAIMLITTTYAWFSVQRDVEIYGLKVNVEVAENLQISLDGEKWTNTIEIKDMKQLYGTAAKDATYQAVKNQHANYIPIQLLPVSTIGNINEETGRITFAQGTIIGTTLNNITLCSETDIVPGALIKGDGITTVGMEDNNSNHPYLVFDMYLRSISKADEDILELNEGSIVTATGTQTGLEGSVRIGFLAYDDNADLLEKPEIIRTLGTGRTVDGTEQVKTGEFAIWEPNYNQHTEYVVSNDKRIENVSSDYITLPLNTALETLTEKTITNVQDDTTNTTATTVATAYVNRPTQATADTDTDSDGNNDVFKGQTAEKINLQTVGSTEENATYLKIGGNKITKVRVYLWLEGQDPDCVDLASTGDQVNATIKLTKEKNETTETTETEDIIAASDITADYYGAYVTNYTPTNGASVGWRIFHSDGSNIYLIADDYVENKYVPAGKGGTAIGKVGDYRIYYMDIFNDYTGSSDIASELAEKWLSKYTYTSTNNNMKMVAYMLDTSIWSGFEDGTYAEYVIGGPTIELFVASYNVTHTDKTIETQVSDITGYQIKWSGGSFENEISGLGTSESLYVRSETTKAFGMQVASPSAADSNSILAISRIGAILESTINIVNYGIRPIVCLDSSIRIEKQTDGTYLIVE